MSARPDSAISVVIPTHSRRDRLPELLDAVAPEAADEIVVVVNACRDGSMELLESRATEDPRVRPLFVDAPGQTLALEAGIERAEGDLILMLDDDVLPDPGLVDGHARWHASSDSLVVVGYMPVSQTKRRHRGEFAQDLYARDYESTCREYESDPDSILRGLWAGNISMRREDCLRVGLRAGAGMPEGYGYHEDRDFGLRCEAAGLRGVFDRELRARHMYEKTPEAFLRAAHNSGVTRAAVHATHADRIGPLPEDCFESGVSGPGRLLIRWARHEPAHRPILASLRAIAAGAGALRLFRVESHAGYLMGKIEQQRGAAEATARTAGEAS